MEVEGTGAIITGGGTGVGRATALALARLGCSVVVNYSRSREEAEKTAAEVEGFGVRAVAVQADVADDAACRALVDAASREIGPVRILINNGATTVFVPHGELDRIGPEDWDRILRVNLMGTFQCARAARDAIEAAGGGEIVNVSSISALTGIGSSIPYCASKAGVNSLTVTLARALAPNIRVNGVMPGFITGRWTKEWFGGSYDTVKQMMEQRSVLGRLCDPEDVADAILSIITGSDLITGQVIAIDPATLMLR
jgi:3-oxoacyl-[acyl-carrier protein] reductase